MSFTASLSTTSGWYQLQLFRLLFLVFSVFLCHSSPGPSLPLQLFSDFLSILENTANLTCLPSYHHPAVEQVSQSLPLLTWILTACPSKPNSPWLQVSPISRTPLPQVSFATFLPRSLLFSDVPTSFQLHLLSPSFPLLTHGHVATPPTPSSNYTLLSYIHTVKRTRRLCCGSRRLSAFLQSACAAVTHAGTRIDS